MKKIKISIPGQGRRLDISQYVGNDEGVWGDCRFYVNDPNVTDVDFWFVVDDLRDSVEHANVPAECVCYLSAEVVYGAGYFDRPYMARFLDQFSHIISCHDIYRNNASCQIPFLSWMVNANHGASLFARSERDVTWLSAQADIGKTKELSVFCSNKAITLDHKLRIRFVEALKAHFGERIDWYGNGVNSLPDKWQGIAPYKYHIVLENKVACDVITEKLYDSFLGLAYPIYWGAPNVGEYFSSDSYSLVNVRDLNGSIRKIEALLASDCRDRNLPALLESRGRVLKKYNPYARMANIATASSRACRKDEVTLYSRKAIAFKRLDLLGSFVMDKVADKAMDASAIIMRVNSKLFG